MTLYTTLLELRGVCLTPSLIEYWLGGSRFILKKNIENICLSIYPESPHRVNHFAELLGCIWESRATIAQAQRGREGDDRVYQKRRN